MDFHTLTRRQLQALCKKNKIPANLTNVAMADSLKALDMVEGIEEFLMEQSNIETPIAPRTGCRSSARRMPVKEDGVGTQIMTRSRRGAKIIAGDDKENVTLDVPENPAGQSRRRRAPIAPVRENTEKQLDMEMELEKKEQPSQGEEKSGVPETPMATTSHRLMRTTRFSARTGMEAGNQKVEASTKKVYSTRGNTRLLEKKMMELSLIGDVGEVESAKIPVASGNEVQLLDSNKMMELSLIGGDDEIESAKIPVASGDEVQLLDEEGTESYPIDADVPSKVEILVVPSGGTEGLEEDIKESKGNEDILSKIQISEASSSHNLDVQHGQSEKVEDEVQELSETEENVHVSESESYEVSDHSFNVEPYFEEFEEDIQERKGDEDILSKTLKSEASVLVTDVQLEEIEEVKETEETAHVCEMESYEVSDLTLNLDPDFEEFKEEVEVSTGDVDIVSKTLDVQPEETVVVEETEDVDNVQEIEETEDVDNVQDIEENEEVDDDVQDIEETEVVGDYLQGIVETEGVEDDVQKVKESMAVEDDVQEVKETEEVEDGVQQEFEETDKVEDVVQEVEDDVQLKIEETEEVIDDVHQQIEDVVQEVKETEDVVQEVEDDVQQDIEETEEDGDDVQYTEETEVVGDYVQGIGETEEVEDGVQKVKDPMAVEDDVQEVNETEEVKDDVQQEIEETEKVEDVVQEVEDDVQLEIEETEEAKDDVHQEIEDFVQEVKKTEDVEIVEEIKETEEVEDVQQVDQEIEEAEEVEDVVQEVEEVKEDKNVSEMDSCEVLYQNLNAEPDVEEAKDNVLQDGTKEAVEDLQEKKEDVVSKIENWDVSIQILNVQANEVDEVEFDIESNKAHEIETDNITKDENNDEDESKTNEGFRVSVAQLEDKFDKSLQLNDEIIEKGFDDWVTVERDDEKLIRNGSSFKNQTDRRPSKSSHLTTGLVASVVSPFKKPTATSGFQILDVNEEVKNNENKNGLDLTTTEVMAVNKNEEVMGKDYNSCSLRQLKKEFKQVAAVNNKGKKNVASEQDVNATRPALQLLSENQLAGASKLDTMGN